MRLPSLAVFGAALLLVGCAHYAPQSPTITYVPDALGNQPFQGAPVVVEQQASRATQPTLSHGSTRRTAGLGMGSAMLREDSERREFFAGQPSAAQRGKSTNNGKQGDPSQLNLPMLIKMGGMHRDLGANRNTEASDQRRKDGKVGDPAEDDSPRLSRNRMADRSEKNKRPQGMLNLPMLIKMGGLARFLENAEQKSTKGDPALLNIGMLIKMGGLVRGLESDKATSPTLRRIPEQVKHGGMGLPEAVQERRRRAAANAGTNPSRMSQRDLVGGRCFGTLCDP